jgi:hypothetical protein
METASLIVSVGIREVVHLLHEAPYRSEVDGPARVRFPAVQDLFSPRRPDRIWGLPNLLTMGTGGKAAGA